MAGWRIQFHVKSPDPEIFFLVLIQTLVFISLQISGGYTFFLYPGVGSGSRSALALNIDLDPNSAPAASYNLKSDPDPNVFMIRSTRKQRKLG